MYQALHFQKTRLRGNVVAGEMPRPKTTGYLDCMVPKGFQAADVACYTSDFRLARCIPGRIRRCFRHYPRYGPSLKGGPNLAAVELTFQAVKPRSTEL